MRDRKKIRYKVWGLRQRRERAQERLKQQLESGLKTKKKSTEKVSLTEKDKKRITKEITRLTEILNRT